MNYWEYNDISEDDSDSPSSQPDLRTMDSEYDKRVEKAFKKIKEMKKLRNRYKSLLVWLILYWLNSLWSIK